MDPQIVKYLAIALVGVLALGVAPIVMALLSHQQKMTALLTTHSLEAAEVSKRLELMERRLEQVAAALPAPTSDRNSDQPPAGPRL